MRGFRKEGICFQLTLWTMFCKPNLWLSQGMKAEITREIQFWWLLGTNQKSAQLGPQGGS